MSANSFFNLRGARRKLRAAPAFLAFFAWCVVCPAAGDAEEAEMAVAKLVHPLEKAGFDFRADVWERDLQPDLGKAVRLQLFKGNEYRVCLAVGERTGVKLQAHVLDIGGEKIEAAADDHGWGLVLTVKPKRTGVYVVTISQSGSKAKTVTCAMIMGYK